MRWLNTAPALAIAFLAAGCATSASSLKPDTLSSDQGAFFGNVTVYNNGENVTKACYVRFSDDNDDRKAYITLDGTGWIFGAVAPGTTYLSNVNCTIGDVVKYNVFYETRALKFDVRKGKDFAYFGNVEIELNSNGNGVAAATILAGSVGNAIAANAAAGNEKFKVHNRLEEAVTVYRSRYEKSAANLAPFASLASGSGANNQRMPASVKK